MRKEVILIGPMGVGKTTTALLLSEKLQIQSIGLDDIRWYYYYKQGYSIAHAKALRQEKGFRNGIYPYWKPFEASSVVAMLADFQDCVFHFGAGQSVYEDPALFAKVQDALNNCENVVLLIPSRDHAESLAYLVNRFKERGKTPDEDMVGLLKLFIEHPSNWTLAKHIVFTKDKSPSIVCDEVLSITQHL
ncbi:shikimate kinase [Rhodocytophaga rosea]|uniref:Shikimate kinase n=1 Tax=Rhodocytophaga rosea TaxID=2704465 RepID=A0A6C0GQX9_9BACT|nr:shikimate kinase [Rhodocytophaga rosea]QHT69972.1 shikimate kinase [Rhodocytophaga rosea]